MRIKKAGCILLNKENKKIGLIYRQKQKDYSFPKGHMEEGETLEQCAIRETEEETGRMCKIISNIKLPVMKYLDSKGQSIETYCFIAIDTGKSKKVFAEDLVHDLVWVPIEKVEAVLSYENLIDFWKEIKADIIEVFENEES